MESSPPLVVGFRNRLDERRRVSGLPKALVHHIKDPTNILFTLLTGIRRIIDGMLLSGSTLCVSLFVGKPIPSYMYYRSPFLEKYRPAGIILLSTCQQIYFEAIPALYHPTRIGMPVG